MCAICICYASKTGYKYLTLFASRTVLVLEILGFKLATVVASNGSRCCTVVASISFEAMRLYVERVRRFTGWEELRLRAFYVCSVSSDARARASGLCRSGIGDAFVRNDRGIGDVTH